MGADGPAMESPTEQEGFKLPEGFTVPDNTNPGDTFEALVTLKLGDDGTATPTAIDGIPIKDEPTAPPSDEKMPFADRVQQMAKPLGSDAIQGGE